MWWQRERLWNVHPSWVFLLLLLATEQVIYSDLSFPIHKVGSIEVPIS